MPVVEAILKLAARYGKRFPDEEAVRQRCKDAYESAKSAQQANSTSGSGAPVPGIDATVLPAEATSRCVADEGPEPVGSVQEPGSVTSSARRRRAKYAVSTVAIFAILTVAVTLILLHPTPLAGSVQAASGCLDRSGDTSWGAGEIHVCVSGGQGSYSGYTTDKEEGGHCVRWRIDWDNKPTTYTPWACPQGGTTKFDFNALPGMSGIRNVFLERVKVSANAM